MTAFALMVAIPALVYSFYELFHIDVATHPWRATLYVPMLCGSVGVLVVAAGASNDVHAENILLATVVLHMLYRFAKRSDGGTE